MSETWAIVGSRDYGDLDAVRAFVHSLPQDAVVISGGARGVDRAVETAARRCGLSVESWRPEKLDGHWRVCIHRSGHFPKLLRETFPTFAAAAFWRNGKMVERADKVQAFHDGCSRGTADTIRKASRAGKLAGVVVWPPA